MFAACSDPGTVNPPDTTPKAGNVSGVVHLEDGANPEGVTITLTGRSGQATTDANGTSHWMT